MKCRSNLTTTYYAFSLTPLSCYGLFSALTNIHDIPLYALIECHAFLPTLIRSPLSSVVMHSVLLSTVMSS